MRLTRCKTNAFAETVLGKMDRRVKAMRLITKFWYRILCVCVCVCVCVRACARARAYVCVYIYIYIIC
jgi:hypothetical protein